jgi:hypothetical protein
MSIKLDAETERILLEAEIELNEQWRAVGVVPHSDLRADQCEAMYGCQWHQRKFDSHKPFA